METPALCIKIKGADAISALTKGQLVGVAKLKGGAALAKGGKLALLKGAEIEGEGLIATKHGAVLAEFEGALAKGGSAAKGAAAKGAAAKAAAVKSGASAGALWSSKGFGLGWGIGALGPVLVLGALGLGAVGLYLYRRNKKLEEETSFDEDDVALPTV